MSGIRAKKKRQKKWLFIWNREYLEIEKDNGIRRNSQFVEEFTEKRVMGFYFWTWETIKNLKGLGEKRIYYEECLRYRILTTGRGLLESREEATSIGK